MKYGIFIYRQATVLKEHTSPDQAAHLEELLAKVNRDWEELLCGVLEKQRELEQILLRLGQSHHALNELLVWIERTDSTLDELKTVLGDPMVIEVELAKLKVVINDIQAHQTSVDALNDAGHQLAESASDSEARQRLELLNSKWGDLLDKATHRQRELEDALKEARAFSAQIQDLMQWLNDINGSLSASKPVGGLPQTASDYLQGFMETFNELEQTRPKIAGVLQQGSYYLERSINESLSSRLRSLQQGWDNVLHRANDNKIELEAALKEATEFHDTLQIFIDWLTNAEKSFASFAPASLVLETILDQIEQHKLFQKDLGVQREVLLDLSKRGIHLTYVSQKQDVILIKNVLISAQSRWERILSKTAERTRTLDQTFKEAKEFNDLWSGLYGWLDDAAKSFNDSGLKLNQDRDKMKRSLDEHQEFQRKMGAKQPTYDALMRQGKLVKDCAPKTDEPLLKQMLSDMKAKWQAVSQKSIDRQRKLEEGLLFSGQFKDAIQALVDWLGRADLAQMSDGPVHGDLDTVVNLREQQDRFEEELSRLTVQTKQVRQTADELLTTASEDDKVIIQQQVAQLDATWQSVMTASKTRSCRLVEALAQAETLHKAVNVLLEWLSDSEMKLRFSGPLPEEEPDAMLRIAEHQKYLNFGNCSFYFMR